ncbi:translation factor GTPase family protein [Lutispora thermophila]|uniref:Small GTP-binding protein domain-containing protein n=1 Tax=Lutispora thermophila DSM 19022 TaxID=1122184 RepID=A0A1M6D6R3_9FIRM|nr:TetM/TetW/TetO/TetS family tetracycline resistance ribosomal protection protein [Lutispora thermophila]SHI68905.1 small GTP-binding protein domain-containing protein [Lutispora thermophila DSM 19022]
MKKLVIGILAHVDAGKTTLSESLLYLAGKIRKLGRVDKKDTYLDNYELERARGITIFSKQAVFEFEDMQITLLDTPGHVDFSTEMERTLQVLDYAILVISGMDGIQAHTMTLWRLLSIYKIPVFIFINKMDQAGTDKGKIMNELKKQLSDGCIEFEQDEKENFYDQMAMCDEVLMEAYLETGNIQLSQIKTAIRERKVFPCFFGSALRLEGVEEFIRGIVMYSQLPTYPSEFGAKVFKIGRDEQGNRLTYMKITGGKLKTRDILSNGIWEEKVTHIRIYSGQKFEAVNVVEAGSVCAVTGLTQTKPGEGLGIEKNLNVPVLEPVLSYQIILPEDCDPRVIMPKLRLLEEEDPELHIVWDEQLQEIQVKIMGEVQIEVLQSLIKDRFGIDVSFDSGKIVYKETIGNAVEGVGHFEPLRHYAEVHLLMEPGERGSGLKFDVRCSEDVLSKSWQRLILSHLEEKVHKGVLTGSDITDMKITLVSGRAHNKHTQGGDFREATYRAVRQGLMEAESILLEPYYYFQLQVPEKMVGRAMTDIDKMHGICQISHIDDGMAVVTGTAPVATMRNYQKEVMIYTKGQGRLFCSLMGYEPCHNTEEVIDMIGYDAEADVNNPADSVFCANGTSFFVKWYEVKEHMHVESYFNTRNSIFDEIAESKLTYQEEKWIAPEEVDKILNKTYYANQGRKNVWQNKRKVDMDYYKSPVYSKVPKEIKEEYLLVDGYNVIFAWPELKELAETTMDGAKVKLLDALCNYQSIRKCRIIVVFDAYRVQGHPEEVIDYYNIHVVYTREAQTADQYIEKFTHENQDKYNITVATSDGLQQIIIRGAGCALLSARELKEEIQRTTEMALKEYKERQEIDINYLGDTLSTEAKEQMDEIIKRGTGK